MSSRTGLGLPDRKQIKLRLTSPVDFSRGKPEVVLDLELQDWVNLELAETHVRDLLDICLPGYTAEIQAAQGKLIVNSPAKKETAK